uniref:DEAD/DEAH box RNA helicase putative n=1 Tax=Albugo laibachii Nc14 TaxID=890382 RepID=F0VZY8_9STRA|nr:DEAD/DEAH box RNA helicase putative [Albugo laibachii Nc14]|eukprot:CCA14359.1 DEAD/DEAH box RNA helicase putative [Albugo laibachii Nc14]
MATTLKSSDDDLIRTIASDDELSLHEASSDDESDIRPNLLPTQANKLDRSIGSKNDGLAEDFQFEEDERMFLTDHRTHVHSNNLSSSRTTFLQQKIDERRKTKNIDCAVHEKGEEEKQHDTSNTTENCDKDDEKLDKADVTSHSTSDEDDEEISDKPDLVEEEAKLQEALQSKQLHAKNKSEPEQDEEERVKALAFFENNPFVSSGNMKVSAIKVDTFADFKLSRPILRALNQMELTKPTLIQEYAIPMALLGKDICASAQTGSGKTAAFLLPILERLQLRTRRIAATRVIIICPVRELATQCQSVLIKLARFTDITSALVVGGLPLKAQELELRTCPDIIVCTPGRMIDHLRNSPSVHLDSLEILVLDEADRLLELGFTEEIQEIVRMCPRARQTMLFSATMTSKIDQLIALSMKRPVRICADPLYDMSKHLVQEFVRIRPNREADRDAILLALCTRAFTQKTIVFMETKVHAHRMMILFGLSGIKAAELHGNLTQQERLDALEKFRQGAVDILLCTDVAARGIDVKGVRAVINYEMPKDITTYVHRVGRTARAGQVGRAVTLTSEYRRLIMKQVTRHCHGFAKSRAVPDSVITQWKAKIQSLQQDITHILTEEKVEKRMHNVEKEARRAQNLISYQDEITSRPARTWFVSEKEKKKIQENAAIQRLEDQSAEAERGKSKKRKADGDSGADEAKPKHLNHRKRRLQEIRQHEEQLVSAHKQHDEDGQSIKPAKKPFTKKSVAGAAKQAKRSTLQAARQKEQESIAELSNRKRQKRQSIGKGKDQTRSMFGSDIGDAKNSKKQSRLPGTRKPAFEFKEKITDRKHHSKKSKQAFKSKSKFKRR